MHTNFADAEYIAGYNVAKALLKTPEFRDLIKAEAQKLTTKDHLEGFEDSISDNAETEIKNIIIQTKSD